MIRALRRPAAWPLLAVFAWFVATIGVRSFAVPDEGRYSGVAWAMVTSGDWLVPRLDGLPYFHKPPLFYWMTAAMMRIAGPVEWAARVAPLFGAMAGATALYLFARRWRDEPFARRVLLVLATQVLAFIGAQFANLDMLVAGCIAVTVLACAHAVLCAAEGGERPRAVLATAYLFAGLGLLAKGLIGIVLPALVILAWLALARRWRLVPALAWWPGVLLFLLVAAPWFVLMQRAFPGFAWYFFYVQQFSRYAAGGFNNRQPLLFYPAVLAVLAFPWSLWVLRALRVRRAASEAPRELALRGLAWSWLAVVTLFFSLPQSKLVGYIFPVAFPLAWLAADLFARLAATSPRAHAWWRASVALAACACVGTIAFGALKPFHSTRPLGLALRQAAPGDRVVFVQHYWFDVPVYARLRRPVIVLDAWNDGSVQEHDDWRRELADAAAFDPRAAGALLLPVAGAPAAWCSGTPTWVLGEARVVQQLPVLAAATLVAAQGDVRLWRLPAAAPGCPARGAPLQAHA